jgi:hypothetical protein
MLTTEFKSKFNEFKLACGLHNERMMFAHKKMENIFPITSQTYSQLTPIEISLTDQLIYRFSKLQDTMGNKFFPLILQGLGEDISSMPFIDMLNRLEKLKILENHNEWLIFRETRNQVTHEYPFLREEFIEGLNELYVQVEKLSHTWRKIESFVDNRFVNRP